MTNTAMVIIAGVIPLAMLLGAGFAFLWVIKLSKEAGPFR